MFGGLSQLTEGLKKNWDRLEATMDTAVGAKTPSSGHADTTTKIDSARLDHDINRQGSRTASAGPTEQSAPRSVLLAPHNKSDAEGSFWSAWSSPAASSKPRNKEDNTHDDHDKKIVKAKPVEAAAALASTAESPTPSTASRPSYAARSGKTLSSAVDAGIEAAAKSTPRDRTTPKPAARQDESLAIGSVALKEKKAAKTFISLTTTSMKSPSRSPINAGSPGGVLLDASQLRAKLKLAIRKLKEGRLKQTRAEERISSLEAQVQQFEQKQQLEQEQRLSNTQSRTNDDASSLLNSSSGETDTTIITNLRSEVTTLGSTRDELKHRVTTLTGQLERLQQQYEEERTQSEADFTRTLSIETTRHATEVASLTSAVAEKNALIAALREDVVQRDTKVAAIIEEGMGWSRREEKQSRLNKKLREKLLTTEEERDQLTHQADTLRASVASLETQIADARADSYALKSDLKEALSRASKVLAAEAKVETLEAALRKEQELAVKRSSRIAELQRADELTRTQGAAIEESDAHVAAMKTDLAEARETLTHVREDAAVVENRLQLEVKALHSKWQQAETRNEELGEQISASTRPLLRQITALQNLLEEQRGVWQASEAALTQRAVRAETNSARAAEQQSAASTDAQTMRLALARSEEKLRVAEAAREAARVAEAARTSELETECAAKSAAVQEAEQALMSANTRWKGERKTAEARRSEERRTHEKMSLKIQKLTRTLEKERARGEQARAKLAALEAKHVTIANSDRAGSSNDMTTSMVKQGTSALDEYKSALDLVISTGTSVSAGEGSGAVGVQMVIGESDGSAISSFHANRRARARESSWRTRCLEAEASRESLAAKLCELGIVETKFSALREEHGQLLQRQETLLVMLGEKADRVEELESDILEVKRVYRQLAEREFSSA